MNAGKTVHYDTVLTLAQMLRAAAKKSAFTELLRLAQDQLIVEFDHFHRMQLALFVVK